MKRNFFLAAFALVGLFAGAQATSAQSSTWSVDSAHSGVEFSIKHLSVSNVHGNFGVTSGTVVYNPADVTKSSVNVTINVAGVSTSNEARDTHIKSPDFFDAAKFPTATFASTNAWKDASGTIKVNGNLTLHGVTKPVVLTVEAPGAPVTSPMDKKQHAGFSATATITRSDFGIGDKFPDAVLSEAVKLTIEIEVVQQ